MSLRVCILKETAPRETRVAIVPEVAARLVKLGCAVSVEAGAGEAAHFPDAQYTAVGAGVVPDASAAVSGGQIVLVVQPPAETVLDRFPSGSMLIGLLAPHRNAALLERLHARGVTTFAMEKLPRVTRAQAMDVLSSQATVAGYKAALIAAERSGRFFPMLTTAAGTIRPAKALILGAGVAGLQAIATARRLGAVVEAYDVRKAAREQVESLGARFVATAADAEASGGYARELTAEEQAAEQILVAKHVAAADVVIATAQIPGRPAPRLITEAMVARMQPGSVIVDLAAESGGNCAVTQPGESVAYHDVSVLGPLNIPAMLPVHASEMYAKNLYNFLLLVTKNGATLEPDFQDEILAGTVVKEPA
ncbi:MAG: NAD(P) transhydrogenase subunit alpha [Deltaproteobacteria bacterium]|nr:NAD(P) transhydrogenase subunit alpha [Deltaproteobacteria bacterium]